MYKLSLTRDGGVFEHRLNTEQFIIGRQEDCDIKLDASSVSRHHARLFKLNGTYWVEDLHSSNGTLINNHLLRSAEPLQDGDQLSIGGVQLGFHQIGSTHDTDYDTDDTTMATRIYTLASQAAQPVLENRPEEKLRAIMTISRRLAQSRDLDNHLPIIIESLFEIFPKADRGAVVMRDPDSRQFRLHLAKDRHRGEVNEASVSATVLNRVFSEKIGILSTDTYTDSRFDSSKSIVNFDIRSVMCAPLLGLDGQAIGAISLDIRNARSRFSAEDLELLTTVAGQAALSYENARLVAGQVEQQKQAHDLEMARRIQQALLPPRMPQLAGYEFFSGYEPASAVGGDYLDCFPAADGKLCVALGDVAGKGVSASLLMSRLSSVIQSSLQFVEDPLEAFSYINRHMCKCCVEGRYVTLVIAIADLNSHEVVILNGGHMPPIVRSPAGKLSTPGEQSVGIPLGIVDDYPFELQTLRIQPGESIVFYSDGITEARNNKGQLYGLERLHSVLSMPADSGRHFGQTLLNDVHRHVGGHAPSDDISLMCFSRKPVPEANG